MVVRGGGESGGVIAWWRAEEERVCFHTVPAELKEWFCIEPGWPGPPLPVEMHGVDISIAALELRIVVGRWR